MIFIVLFFIALGVVVFLKLVSLFLAEKSVVFREELSCYECGFEHNNLSRVPFSFRYFYLTLVFLLFDLEIVFLLFIVFYCFSSFYFFGFLLFCGFVVLLFLGLLYEWKDGTLDWLS